MGVFVYAAAAAIGAAGSIMSGKEAQSAAYDQADQIGFEAARRAKNIRYMARQTLGAARADYAAYGVDVNSGSPLIAAHTISYNSEVDALNAIASGEATANSIRRSGRAAQTAGFIQAGSTILGAFGSAYGARGVSAGGTINPASNPNWVGPR